MIGMDEEWTLSNEGSEGEWSDYWSLATQDQDHLGSIYVVYFQTTVLDKFSKFYCSAGVSKKLNWEVTICHDPQVIISFVDIGVFFFQEILRVLVISMYGQ